MTVVTSYVASSVVTAISCCLSLSFQLAGCELFSILEPLKERVAVIISADLAHTHMSSGPYGFSNASEPFDQVKVIYIYSPIYIPRPPHELHELMHQSLLMMADYQNMW